VGRARIVGTDMLIASPWEGLGFYTTQPGNWLVTPQKIIRGLMSAYNEIFIGDYMITSQFLNEFNRNLVTLDISDPSNAFIANLLETDGQISHFAYSPPYIYATTHGFDLYKFYVSDPLNPVMTHTEPHESSTYGLAVSGDFMFVSDTEPGIDVYDISTINDFVKVGNVAAPIEMYNLIIIGNALYAYNDKIYVYSITNPVAPVLEDSYIAADAIRNFTIEGNYLYVNTTSTLEIIDISSPLEFQLVSSTPIPSNSTSGIDADGQFLYVPTYNIGQNYMRIWPPDDPEWLGSLVGSENIQLNINYVHNGFLYTTGYPYGLEIVDLYQ